MSRSQLPGANGQVKAALATVLRRAPALVGVVSLLWRLRMPRFTAGVVGVIVDDAGRILLLEHVFHVQEPWGLPGGWLNRRESPELALARELREEIGLDITVTRHLMTLVSPNRSHLDFAYLGQPCGEVRHLSAEILDYTWADPSALPPLHPVHQRAVDAAFAVWVDEGQL